MQPNPNSPRTFILCVKNLGGGYAAYVLNCPRGTIFDLKTAECVHEQTAPSVLTSSPRPTTRSTGFPTQPATSRDSRCVAENPDRLSCKTDGLHAHPHSPKKFVSCVKNTKSGYSAYVLHCPGGTIFDHKVKVCIHAPTTSGVSSAVEDYAKPESSGTSPSSKSSRSRKTSGSAASVVVTDLPAKTGEKATHRAATRLRNAVTTPKNAAPLLAERPSTRDQCLKAGYRAGVGNKFHRSVLGSYGVYNFGCPGTRVFKLDVCTCV